MLNGTLKISNLPEVRFQQVASISTLKNNFSAIDAIRNISEAFNRNGSRVVVGGSVSFGVLAKPRKPRDIDLHAPLLSKGFLSYILRDFDIDTLKYRDLRKRKEDTILASFKYRGWKVDLFISPNEDKEVRKRLFQHSVAVKGINFVPLECLCFWKMVMNKDKQDITDLFSSFKPVDKFWTREQLLEYEPALVKEWDELSSYHR